MTLFIYFSFINYCFDDYVVDGASENFGFIERLLYIIEVLPEAWKLLQFAASENTLMKAVVVEIGSLLL